MIPKDETLCREDFKSIFKEFEIISTDHDNGFFTHAIGTIKHSVSIREDTKAKDNRRYVIRYSELKTGRQALLAMNTKEKCLETLNRLVNPPTWMQKKIIKIKPFIQKTKTILWKIKPKLQKSSQ